MKNSTLTIRLDDQLQNILENAIALSGKNLSEVVSEALARQLKLMQFENHREKVMPFAEAQGYLTDEDVFEEVS